jgi:transcriptional regulator
VYVPHFNAMDDPDERRAFVAAARVGQLVTVGPDGVPLATLLPILWEGDRVVAHMAKANPQWRSIAEGSIGLVIVSGPDAYISPSWYASKVEHGRVVPTWNYSAVHLTGPVTVHTDPVWLRRAVESLTHRHEAGRTEPWQVADAPQRYVDGQLRAIVGIDMAVQRVEGKAKLSQNRSADDLAGVVDGLQAEGDTHAALIAEQMAESLARPTDPNR